MDHHLKLADTGSNHGKLCKLCGVSVYYKLTICGTNLHPMSNREKPLGLTSFMIIFLVWHAMTQMFLRSEDQDRDTLPKTRRRMTQGWKSTQMMTYNTVWEVIK